MTDRPYVSRAGLKLAFALDAAGLDLAGLTAADLGCNAGGFTDVLLRRGVTRVYAVDTGYGMLDWSLRNDPRVVVMERTNAMHVRLPEPVNLIAIDVGWTRQRHILPAARRLIGETGDVFTLVKPHYESPQADLRKGVLPPERMPAILETVDADLAAAGFTLVRRVQSPIVGAKGNIEFVDHLRPSSAAISGA